MPFSLGSSFFALFDCALAAPDSPAPPPILPFGRRLVDDVIIYSVSAAKVVSPP